MGYQRLSSIGTCGQSPEGKAVTALMSNSSFIRTIIEEDKPDAALLVACAYECNKVMMALGALATYGVSLDSDGCVGTEVTESNVIAAMRIGLESRTGAETG